MKLTLNTLEYLKAKYGPNWGLKVDDRERKPPEPAPTLDELKAHYEKFNLGFKPKENADEGAQETALQSR